MTEKDPGDNPYRDLARTLSDPQNEITALKQALEASSATLEAAERKAERASELAAAAVEETKHFTYAVTHDLRQPLRSMLSYSQLLQRKRPDDPELKELTSFIIDGANEMNMLIENLQRYSRAGEGLRRTNVRLDLAVQWALMRMQTLVRESRAEITYNGLPELAIDESQFVQLFEHILTNSIKYSGANPPRIEVSAEEDSDGYIISVRDNGVGIPPKYQEAVFVPFKRLHGKETPGVGLGLPICRKIVRAHGGRIWVESDGETGSTVRFTIPPDTAS